MLPVLLVSFIIPLVTSAHLIAKDGACGAKVGLTCLGSTFGNCCSQWNFCGASDIHCGVGCQAEYGDCNEIEEFENKNITPDGLCGGELGYTCTGSVFGDCCSSYGFCGKTEVHCGTS
jgi:hypothetical protein